MALFFRVLDRIGERYARYVDAVCARPRRALALLLIACVPATILTGLYFADVRAGLQELLPSSAPSVRALEEIHGRLGGQSHLTIIAQSDDAPANRRFIDEMAERLAKRNLPEARSIQARVTEERAWIESRAPLLMPKAEFDPLLDEIEDAIRSAKAKASPFYVALDDEGDPWEGLNKRLDKETSTRDRFKNGYLETADGKTVVMLIWLQGSEVDLGPSERLLNAAMEEAAAIKSKYPASMVVAWNGEVPNLVEEHAAILSDLSLSTVLVFGLVTLLIALYFRSTRAVVAVGASLLTGLVFTFAIGRLTAGSLNSNTAFLGSIIAGNGINYPLIFLAYYRACDPSWPMRRAILDAARRALPGTLGAAATASAAYGGLAVSSFKGFSQFGWIGGAGMVTTWVLTYLAMPIAINLLNPPRQGEPHSRTQKFLSDYFARPALPRLVAAALVGLALLGAGAGAYRAARSGLYEMDLRQLRNRDSLAHGSASWDRKMNEVFGVWLNPVVSLVPDPAKRGDVAKEVARVLIDGSDPIAERVETISDWVPPPDDQSARLERLRKLSATMEGLPRDQIPAKARRYIDLWLAQDKLRPIEAREVPRTMRQGLTEVNGETDRVVLIYPSLRINFDDGNNIIRFADRLATAKLPAGAVTGGAFLFMAEIIRLVRDQAPLVILMVCLLVAAVLVPAYLGKPRRILITVGTVGAVALLAQATMVAAGVRVNMLNFAAVPITIGIGADYVVNLYGAMDAFQADARRACARMGGAIFLCSLTTVVGYLSLLVAQSGALRSFGQAAVLGEVMAVGMVLLVLPVVLRKSDA